MSSLDYPREPNVIMSPYKREARQSKEGGNSDVITKAGGEDVM